MDDTAHPLVFLVGLHGTGKSTIGRIMATMGWHHFGLGDIGRLVRRRAMPKGYSMRFLTRIAAHVPGERMAQPLIDALMDEIAEHRTQAPVVIDGFPVEPHHVARLPEHSIIAQVMCMEAERINRLQERAAVTPRKWTNASEPSLRDKYLGLVLDESFAAGLTTLFVNNDHDPQRAALNLLASIQIAQSDILEED